MNVPEELMAKYLERRKRDVELCFQDMREGNFKHLEKVGHQLKGNGVTFGHPELSDIGRELEEAARIRNIQSLHRAIDKFSDWVSEMIS